MTEHNPHTDRPPRAPISERERRMTLEVDAVARGMAHLRDRGVRYPDGPPTDADLRASRPARVVRPADHDAVAHPSHYTGRFGIECIDITRHMSFCTGNAVKYVWRHEDKGTPLLDLRKAVQYLDWAIEDAELVTGKARAGLLALPIPMGSVYTGLIDIGVSDLQRARYTVLGHLALLEGGPQPVTAKARVEARRDGRPDPYAVSYDAGTDDAGYRVD